jgi:hypothetical protein
MKQAASALPSCLSTQAIRAPANALVFARLGPEWNLESARVVSAVSKFVPHINVLAWMPCISTTAFRLAMQQLGTLLYHTTYE